MVAWQPHVFEVRTIHLDASKIDAGSVKQTPQHMRMRPACAASVHELHVAAREQPIAEAHVALVGEYLQSVFEQYVGRGGQSDNFLRL